MATKTDKTNKKDTSLLEQFELFYEAIPGSDYTSQALSSQKGSKTLKRNRK